MAIAMPESCLPMAKNKKKRLNDQIAEVEEAIAHYQKGVGSHMMKEDDDGNDELTIDVSAIPLYKDCSNGSLLNPTIYEYAEEATSLFRHHKKLTIHWIFAPETSVEEQTKVEMIFKTHYANAYKMLRSKLRQELILAILFVFLGFLFLSFHLPYISANDNSVYGEILDIFGWVLIWEAGSIVFVNSLDNSREVKRDLFFFEAKSDALTPTK
jgi:hypothetical protein